MVRNYDEICMKDRQQCTNLDNCIKIINAALITVIYTSEQCNN